MGGWPFACVFSALGVAGCKTRPEYEAKAEASEAPLARVELPSSVPAAAPPPSAAPAPSASVSAAASVASSASEGAPPALTVKVSNIGMHIGGGPNDPGTKEPIAKSVEPHFDEFRRCYARVYDQKRAGDVGVDLRIPVAGGLAKVTAPVRTTLKGERFDECIIGVFTSIDFLKPRFTHDVTVSYSLHFAP